MSLITQTVYNAHQLTCMQMIPLKISDKSIDVIEYKLHRDLINTLEWMNKIKLTINLKKTQCMVISTEQRLRNCREIYLYKLRVLSLKNCNVLCAKLLGVYIDKCLTWLEHVDILSKKKLARKIGVLSRLRSLMSSELLLKIVNTIVFPHSNYCCTVWGNIKSKNSLDKLCKLQRFTKASR